MTAIQETSRKLFILVLALTAIRAIAETPRPRPSPTPSPSALPEISVSSAGGVTVSAGIAGYNSALQWQGVSFADQNLLRLAQGLSIGWTRYPAGTASLAFDWTTGKGGSAMLQAFASDPTLHQKLSGAHATTNGMSDGVLLDDAIRFAEMSGQKGIIVCVNGYTDTALSAEMLARTASGLAAAHGVKILAYELSNEPYLGGNLAFIGGSVTGYLNRMRPYAAAIRRGDPSANIAIFLSDAGSQKPQWDNAVQNYPNPFWNMVTYHHYTGFPSGLSVAARMDKLNEVLETKTASYIRGQIIPRFGASMPVIITEFSPSNGAVTEGMQETLYGGIWSAEYALRLAMLGQVRHLGLQQLVAAGGFGIGQGQVGRIQAGFRANPPYTTDTTKLNFGFYASAQAVAYAVASEGINAATMAYATTHDATETVKAGSALIPAIHAQAYRGAGQRILVVTNKGAVPKTMRIRVDGKLVNANLTVVSASGAQPDLVNNATHSAVSAVRSTAIGGVLTIPAYSVVRAIW